MSDKVLTQAEKAHAGAELLYEAIRRVDAAKPTKEDKAEFDRILKEHPAVWTIAGDMIDHTARGLIADVNGSYALQASLRTGWKQMRDDLTRPSDGPLEKLLIQQVVLAWLKLAYTEYAHKGTLLNGNTTLKVADFWERRLSAAQRRYLRACETLARVRRLQLPAMQINIAEQQVNQVNG